MYTHVQLIAYVTKTLTPFVPADPHQSSMKSGKEEVDLKSELLLRSWYMQRVIDFCWKTFSPALGGANTMKIFLAPEFYFRSSIGLDTPVSHYPSHQVMGAMADLSKAYDEVRFDDWLFITGTAVSSFVVSNGSGILNAIHGFYREQARQEHFLCNKSYFSAIDNLKAEMNASNLAPLLATVSNQVFTYGGRRIGIEICLDHTALHYGTVGVLRNEIINNRMQYVDVHLLVACGSPVRDTSLAARGGGYLFRCDGHPGYLGAEVWKTSFNNPRREHPPRYVYPNKTAEKLTKVEILPAELQIAGKNQQDFVAISNPLPL